MSKTVYDLVDDINSLDSDEIVSVIKVNDRFMIRQIRDGMSPSMIMLNEDEARRHLTKLYDRRLKSFESNIKVARNKVYEVWFDGSLLGLYRGTSFEEACRGASENIGLDLKLLYNNNGNISYKGKNFYSSENEMKNS